MYTAQSWPVDTFRLKNQSKKGGRPRLILLLLRKEYDKPYSCATVSGDGMGQYGTMVSYREQGISSQTTPSLHFVESSHTSVLEFSHL